MTRRRQRTRRTRGEGSITDLSGGRGKRWLVRVPLNAPKGHRRRAQRVVIGTRRQAEAIRREMITRRDANLPATLSTMTLGEWLDRFRQQTASRLGPRTRQDYAEDIQRYFTDELLHTSLADLDPDGVQRWIAVLEDRGLGARTIRKAHALLRRALNRALRSQKIAYNPAATPFVDLPKIQRREMQSFSPEQAAAFTRAARDQARLGALFLVMLYGGLRPGETLALKWGDLDGSILRVRRSIFRPRGRNGTYELVPPKTGAGRAVPLPAFVVNELRAYREELAVKYGLSYAASDTFMFPNADGQPLEHNNLVCRHYKPLLKAAGLPTTFRLYDLRHSCATLLLAEGVPAKVVQERLGHASIKLTLDTYTHVLPGMQEDAAAKLDARYGQTASQ